LNNELEIININWVILTKGVNWKHITSF